MKNLENFIHMHKNEFDVYQPDPKVWAGISSGLAMAVPLTKPAGFLGSGSKNILLSFAATSTLLVLGIWAYQWNKSGEAAAPVTPSANVAEVPEPLPQPATMHQANEVPEVKSKAPVAKEEQHQPLLTGTKTSEPVEPGGSVTNMQPGGMHTGAAPSDAEQKDSTYSGIKTLTLTSSGYNFIIKRSNSKMTQVRMLKQGQTRDEETNSEAVLRIVKRGSELVFEYENEGKNKGWRLGYSTVSSGEIEILIPDGEISSITSISSSINLEGYTTPSLSINTISGKVKASDVQAKLSITSLSGSQDLNEISGDLKCETASGSVGVKNLRGNADVQTASGRIELAHTRGNMNCESASGSIRLNDVQGKLDLMSKSGSIKGESVTLMEGCHIESISGSITMDLLNNGSDLSFDLNSISGSLKIQKGTVVAEGSKFLRTGSGKIPVTARTISGSQLYR